jgi:hypothetical protein
MGKSFNNLNDLFKHLEKQANSVLKNEVAEEVIRTMQEKIEDEVYSVYEPRVYERQGYQGGLVDPKNIEVTVESDNTIAVENIRFDGDREVAQIVESGQGYQFDFPYNGAPRPFTEKTREELQSTDRLNQAMKQGLKKRGIDSQ